MRILARNKIEYHMDFGSWNPCLRFSLFQTFSCRLTFAAFFSLDVNEPPTDIIISPTSFPENSPPGAVIGTIRVNDPDLNSTASCRIIGGDSQHLAVSGLKLVAGNQKVDYEALGSTKSLFVTLRCSDEFNLHLDKSFHIDVTGMPINCLMLGMN